MDWPKKNCQKQTDPKQPKITTPSNHIQNLEALQQNCCRFTDKSVIQAFILYSLNGQPGKHGQGPTLT